MIDLLEDRVISLAEAVEFIVDNRGKTAPTSKDGIPLIATNCIDSSDLYPAYKNVRYVSRDTYDNWFRSHPKPDDIIITLKGSKNGAVCLVPNPVDFAIAQDMVALRADADIIYPYYLFAVLRSREVQYQIKTLDVSGVIPNLKKTDFNKLIFPYPSSEVQKKIGDTYYAFCNKIELLHEQNKILETLAQTIFKEWFVNFNYPDLSACGSPAQAGATGDMVESELGLIPKGWRVGELGDIGCNIRDGISAEKIEPEMKYVALEHMPRKSIALDKWGYAGKVASNKFVFKKGSILFGKLRPYFHKVGVAFILGICSTDILVIEPKKEFQKAYLLMHLSSDEFIQYVTLASEGTRMPRTNWKYMKDYTVCLPPDDIMTSFNALIGNLVGKIGNNIFQIQTLSQTRDILLPKLMSGQVRVN